MKNNILKNIKFTDINFKSVQYEDDELYYKESDFFDYYIKILEDPVLDVLNYKFLNFILDRFSKDENGHILYSELGKDFMLKIASSEAKAWKEAEERDLKDQRESYDSIDD